MAKKIFSWNCITNGLTGKAFALAATVYDENENEVATFSARCPIQGTIDRQVGENIIPQMFDIPISYESYRDMLEAFGQFFMEYRNEADVVFHMGVPAEARVIINMYDFGVLRQHDAASPWIDVSSILLSNGHVPTNVNAYNTEHGIKVPMPDIGGIYNPLYSARAIALCYINLMKK